MKMSRYMVRVRVLILKVVTSRTSSILLLITTNHHPWKVSLSKAPASYLLRVSQCDGKNNGTLSCSVYRHVNVLSSPLILIVDRSEEESKKIFLEV